MIVTGVYHIAYLALTKDGPIVGQGHGAGNQRR